MVKTMDRPLRLSSMSEINPDIRPETATDNKAVHSLVDRTFGPGRFAKTAERLREGSDPIAGLSLVAMVEHQLVGCVRLWPVKLKSAQHEAKGLATDLAFLGPIVVAPSCQGLGLGQAMTQKLVEQAFAKGYRAIVLVGALSFFSRLGFATAQNIVLPGPVDPKRILIRYALGQAPISGRLYNAT
jgi:predicted N-acetyltransferase YhbS